MYFTAYRNTTKCGFESGLHKFIIILGIIKVNIICLEVVTLKDIFLIGK